jgi:hypothetical protein
MDIAIERVRKGCYDYGSGKRWGSSKTLKHAKEAALLKLIEKLAEIGDNARVLLKGKS